MKPIDWLVLIIGLWYTWAFVGGIVFTNPVLLEMYATKAWGILGRRFLKALVCFGFVLWRIYG